MKNFENKNVVITGGGSGIGEKIIAELYDEGVKDFAVLGRSMEKLEALKKEFPKASFELYSGDLAKVEDIKEFVAIVEKKWGTVDILINNAGVVSAGSISSISDDDIIAQTNINVIGLILMTKHMLPLLKKSKEAALINVSSGLALISMPFYSPYSATKAAVKAFSESIRRELKDFPIQVVTLYPTGTDTPMMKSSNSGDLHSSEMVAKKLIEGIKNNEIDVILSDLDNVKLNRDHPLEFDKKAAAMFDAFKKRTEKHRSM
jgi:short-subunit dehydrogenase